MLSLALSLTAAAAGAQAAPGTAAGTPSGGAAPASGAPNSGQTPDAASATPGPQSAKATADALYEEARALLKKGEVDAACGKLEESQKLDPAAATLFNLATCEERRGRFGSAVRRWRESLTFDLPGDDKAEASKRLADADKKAGHVVLRFAADVPQGTTATLDGQPLTTAELGVALALDTGEHRIIVSAPGHESRTFPVTAAEGSAPELTLSPGPKLPPSTVTKPVTGTVKPTTGPLKTTTEPTGATFTLSAAFGASRHARTYALLGGGAALGVAAGIVGGDILQKYPPFVNNCGVHNGCLPDEKQAIVDRVLAANILASLAGAAGLAAAVVYFTVEGGPFERTKQDAAPEPKVGLGVGPTGAVLRVEY